MKTFEKRQITKTVTVKMACDLCGAECPNPREGNWSSEEDVSVRTMMVLSEYVYDDSTDGINIDICPKCFKAIYQKRKVSHA